MPRTQIDIKKLVQQIKLNAEAISTFTSDLLLPSKLPSEPQKTELESLHNDYKEALNAAAKAAIDRTAKPQAQTESFPITVKKIQKGLQIACIRIKSDPTSDEYEKSLSSFLESNEEISQFLNSKLLNIIQFYQIQIDAELKKQNENLVKEKVEVEAIAEWIINNQELVANFINGHLLQQMEQQIENGLKTNPAYLFLEKINEAFADFKKALTNQALLKKTISTQDIIEEFNSCILSIEGIDNNSLAEFLKQSLIKFLSSNRFIANLFGQTDFQKTLRSIPAGFRALPIITMITTDPATKSFLNRRRGLQDLVSVDPLLDLNKEFEEAVRNQAKNNTLSYNKKSDPANLSSFEGLLEDLYKLMGVGREVMKIDEEFLAKFVEKQDNIIEFFNEMQEEIEYTYRTFTVVENIVNNHEAVRNFYSEDLEAKVEINRTLHQYIISIQHQFMAAFGRQAEILNASNKGKPIKKDDLKTKNGLSNEFIQIINENTINKKSLFEFLNKNEFMNSFLFKGIIQIRYINFLINIPIEIIQKYLWNHYHNIVNEHILFSSVIQKFDSEYEKSIENPENQGNPENLGLTAKETFIGLVNNNDKNELTNFLLRNRSVGHFWFFYTEKLIQIEKITNIKQWMNGHCEFLAALLRGHITRWLATQAEEINYTITSFKQKLTIMLKNPEIVDVRDNKKSFTVSCFMQSISRTSAPDFQLLCLFLEANNKVVNFLDRELSTLDLAAKLYKQSQTDRYLSTTPAFKLHGLSPIKGPAQPPQERLDEVKGGKLEVS